MTPFPASPNASSRYVHRQPAWSLTVDGETIDAVVRPRLMSLSLTEKRGSDADELEIVLSDHDGQLKVPKKGVTVTLSLGWLDLGEGRSPVLVDKGTFKVDETGHSGAPDVLTIRARSADLTRGFRAQRAQSWSDTTLGGVLGDVAGRNGLQLNCAADKSSLPVAHLAQSRESDAAFLARLGRMHDAVATVKSGKLIFMACAAGQSPRGEEIGTATITRKDGDKHSWKESDRGVYSGVIAEWNDRSAAGRKKAVAGSEDNAKRLTRVYATEKAALRAAEAEFKRLGRGAAEFSLTLAMGRPDLMPEKRLTVSGFKPEIDAAGWLITEARHSLGGSGFTTALQMELGGSSSGDEN